MTFAEPADTWFDSVRTNLKPGSAERVKLSLKQLKKHFGTSAIRGMTTGSCDEWQQRRSPEVGASPFNADRGALKAIPGQAVREGL